MAATSLGAESAYENPCPRTGTAAEAVAWAELEAQLVDVRAANVAEGGNEEAVEAAAARETEIAPKIFALPTADLTHAVRKLELRATLFGQTDCPADAFAEVRRLAGIVLISGSEA